MTRKLAITRRFSLEDLGGENWKGCHIVYRPIPYAEMQELSKSSEDGMDDMAIAKRQFVSGRIVTIGDDGGEQVVDMVADDIVALPVGVIKSYIVEVTGIDPKDFETLQAQSPTAQG